MTNSRWKEMFCILKGGYTFQRDQHVSECCNLVTTFQRQCILDTTRPWSLFREIFGGPKCGRMWRSLSSFVMFVEDPRSSGIALMGFCSHCLFRIDHGLLFLWTSLQTYHYQMHMTTSLLWWIDLQRGRILSLARRHHQVKTQQGSFLITYIVTMAYQMISCQIEELSSYPSFGDLSLIYWRWRSSFPRLFIPKPTVTWNEWIKSWSSIYDAASTISKIAGPSTYRMPSLLTTTPFILWLRRHHSFPTMGTTRSSIYWARQWTIIQQLKDLWSNCPIFRQHCSYTASTINCPRSLQNVRR